MAHVTSLRSYGDPCGIARALDLIGERWALLIVRELVLGAKRFTDLRTGLRGASPNVLSQRLDELEAAGVIRKTRAGAPAYELTPWGQELHPILIQLGRWGAQSLPRPKGNLSVDALLIALEATFDAASARDLEATFELELAGERFVIELERGALHIRRGTARDPDARITTDPKTLRAVAFGDQRIANSTIAFEGNAQLAQRILRMFRRP